MARPAAMETSWNAVVVVAEVSLACYCTLGWSFRHAEVRPGWWHCSLASWGCALMLEMVDQNALTAAKPAELVVAALAAYHWDRHR